MKLNRGATAVDGSQLLEELMRFKPEGLTPNAWAVRAGVGRTIWADLRRHGNPSRRTLEKLLAVAGSSLAEFEALRIGASPAAALDGPALADPARAWRAAPTASIPLFQMARIGSWTDGDGAIPLFAVDRDRPIAQLPRPHSLAVDRGAYAVTIAGDSMWPRFREGRSIAVSPTSAAVGDDALLFLRNGRGALLGELASQAVPIQLRQFNPPLLFEVPRADVEAIHKVIGELI